MYYNVDPGRVEKNVRRSIDDRSCLLVQRSGGTLRFLESVEMRTDGPCHQPDNLAPFESSLARIWLE